MMLELDGVDVRYGATHAVRGLTLEVGANEAVGLMGANGAGKSSTLRAISGLTSSTGRIHFDGRLISGMAPEHVARLGLIHVPEGRRIFADLTVHENLQMGTTARQGRTVGFTFDDVYDLFPALGALRDRAGYALSGGEQQMVALGRALLGAPRLLLVDEPSLGLSPLLAEVVAKSLREIAASTSVLVVEQNVRLALEICTRAVVMSDGEIVLRGTVDELGDREQLLATYLGQRAPAEH